MLERLSETSPRRGHVAAVAILAALFVAGRASAQAPANDECVNALPLNITSFPHTTPLVDAATATVGNDPSMCIGSDQSVWYSFTPADSGVYRFSTCNPSGRAGTLINTVVAVSSGTSCTSLAPLPFGCNDDQGGTAATGSCGSSAGVQVALTAGTTYYIQLARRFTFSSGTMGLIVDRLGQPPANDACSGALPISSNVPAVAPISDTFAATTANDEPMSCITAAYYSTAANSRGVWYTFTPSSDGHYQFDTCDTQSSPAHLVDTAITLYGAFSCAGPFTEVPGACNQSSCGTGASAYGLLTAGTTYYVLAAHGNNNPPLSTASAIQPSVRLLPTPANDLCTAASPLTLGLPQSGTLVAATNNYALDGGEPGAPLSSTASTAPGRDVVYSFTPPAAGDYSFRVTPTTSASNIVVHLGRTCGPDGLVSDVATFANRNTSLIQPEDAACVPLTANETVFAYVDEHLLTNGSNFDIEVSACTLEVEPNDTPATGTQTPTCGMYGRSTPNGTVDADYFSLGSPAMGEKIFAMVDTGSLGTAFFPLRVTTDAVTVEYDNGGNEPEFGGGGSNIGGAMGLDVPLWLQVRNTSTSTQYEHWRLFSVVQPVAASATPEVEPNEDPSASSGGASNYFSGVISTYSDVDYYAFVARQGELVFISADGDPERDGTSFDPALQLLDGSGKILVSVDEALGSVSSTPGTSLTSTTPAAPAEALVFRAREDGVFYVRVASGGSSSTSTGATGNYLLSIARGCQRGGGVEAPTGATGFSPNEGSTNGGTVITITGSGFSRAAAVRVGANYSPSVTWINDTTLTAITPAGPAGPTTVQVVHPGNQAITVPGTFTYRSPPSFSAVTPTSGPADGGTAFTITGTDFIGSNVTVQFGNTTTPVTVNSSTELSGTTLPHAPGPISVTVSTDFGSYTGTNAFTYLGQPRITSITPASGSTTGTTNVTINGVNFEAGTVVRFDGVTAPNAASPTTTQLVVTPPPHAAGTVDVVVVNPDGQQELTPGAYTYIAPPVLTSIMPTSGVTIGGEPVTLSGNNFDSTAKVFFRTSPATNVVVSADRTTITALTPGHRVGDVDVTVENADGQTSTLTLGFNYFATDPAPTVTSLTPTSGTTYGGTVVTLNGTGFQAGAAVTFDGVPATNVTVDVTNQTITATTPAHVFGAVTVIVDNPDFQSATSPTNFTYVAPAPTLATVAVTPGAGPTAVATSITITGDEFLPNATVTLDTAPCGSVTFVSKTTLTCSAPPAPAGFVDVTVTNPDGKSVTRADAFEYIAAPTFLSLSPTSGTTLGGTTVVITGTSFRAPVTVKFGTIDAATVVFNSPTQLTVTTPASAAGTVAVTVTNSDGQSVTRPNAFTYLAPPGVAAIAPTQGYAVGGTNVTLTGSGFRAGATVQFVVGGAAVAATNVVVASATSITARTAAHAPGLADVIVTNTDGQTFTLPASFQFVPAPVATTVSPSNGAPSGGTAITLTGANFLPGATVSLGGSPAYAVNVPAGGTTLTAITNAHPPGVVDVVITNPDGQSATLAGAYTFDNAPVLITVSPDVGPAAGGNTVTLNGGGFVQGAAVRFGTTAATVTNVTSTAITVTAPARPAGVVSVRVANPDGQTTTLTSAYRYINPPTLISLTPATGPTTGGTRVTLAGTLFITGANVTFGGIPAEQVTVLNDTTIEALTPAHAPGAVDVVLTSGTGDSTLAGAYTYEAVAPTLTSVAPASGTTEGGTTVALTGTDFAPTATVKVDGVDATSVVVVSSTLITAVTPAHAPGAVNVDVTNPDGLSATLSSGYTYVAPVTPDEGSITDGGTGGVTGKDDGGTDVIRPAPSCGCNAGGFPALALLALVGLFAFRRRKH